MPSRILSYLALSGALLVVGCNNASSPEGGPPTSVTQVTSGGFKAPTDAVASPDGHTFYFAARTDADLPAVFRVSSDPGSKAESMITGAQLVAPTGLVLSCDGATLYVATGGDDGISSMGVDGASLAPIGVTGAGSIEGLAIGPDCATLYATGHTTGGQPALFKVPATGGAVQVVASGSPLSAPAGLHVDPASVAWVMDRGTSTSNGALYAVAPDDGPPKLVAGNLDVGGGVSLNSFGDTAVIAALDESGAGQLVTIELATGKRIDVPTPGLLSPAGLRTSREAPVFAVVDAKGNAIFRAD